jgi:Holliday junction resolvase RusA-like endonuclease
MAADAQEAMAGAVPLHGAVKVEVLFTFPRLKSHFRTGKRAAELRDDAPLQHDKKPDLDKLVRALGDAITGIVVRDDSQIAVLQARKVYGEAPGARVLVTPI